MKRLAFVLALLLTLSLLTGCSTELAEALRDGKKEEAAVEQAEPEDIETTELEETVVEEEIEEAGEVDVEETEPEEAGEVDVEETEPEEAEKEVLGTAKKPIDVSAEVEQIRKWYQEIMAVTDLETSAIGTSLTAYFHDGEIVSIAEQEQLDDSEPVPVRYTHFYYHDGEPFFVFIEYQNTSKEDVRLYFADGKLIRWIIGQNEPVDNKSDAVWQAYYTEAKYKLEYFQ